MIPIFQNDQDLLKPIRNFGCRFRCLQAIAEFELKQCLSIAQILDSYFQLSQDLEIMNTNCLCGPQEHKIIQKTFCILGNPNNSGRQVGIIHNGVPMGWDGKICSFDYIILHWKTRAQDGHYTLASKTGEEIFDPWDYKIPNAMEKMEIKRELLYRIRRYV